MVTKLAPGEFFGHVRRRRSFGGLHIVETAYPDGMQICNHEHENAYISFAVAGFHRQYIGRRTRDVAPGTLTMHPPGEVHANHWHGDGRCLSIEISPARLEQIREYARCLEQPGESREEVPARLAGRLYEEFRQQRGISPLALEGLTLEILAEISRDPLPGSLGAPPSWLRSARELLRERFAENLSLDYVAGAVGVHPAHLGRAFRRHFGSTPGHYVRELRVALARARLADTDEPLAAVALAAGFADQSHFTNVFRASTGLTPADYRRRRRPRSSAANGRSSCPRNSPPAELP